PKRATGLGIWGLPASRPSPSTPYSPITNSTPQRMASNKDMRRADLAIPYVDPPKSANDADMSSTMSSTLPMAATWLAESPEQKKTAATPAYMSVFMSRTCRFIFVSLLSLALSFELILWSSSSDGAGRYLLPHVPASAGCQGHRCCSSSPLAFALNFLISDIKSHLFATSFTNPLVSRQGQNAEFMSIENLKTFDPFAEADEETGETKQSQNYIHIRIQRTSHNPTPRSLIVSVGASAPRRSLPSDRTLLSHMLILSIERNGRKTLTTVQGLPKKFDQKKILKVIKKKFACNGTIVTDTEMGEVIQLQGDQRKDVQEFLTDKKEGLELDAKTIKSLLPYER
ncbi:Eukaryotic translation initiation factor eIF-1, partial [Penicillium rolfsii]